MRHCCRKTKFVLIEYYFQIRYAQVMKIKGRVKAFGIMIVALVAGGATVYGIIHIQLAHKQKNNFQVENGQERFNTINHEKYDK